MDARRGAFFVIEGTDGSGKATQFALLRDKLERFGYRVATFDFPQYDQPSSYFVRRYLQGEYGTTETVGPYAGSLFYALDRYEAADQMRDALDKGYIVLANRFTGSNMAHQGAKFSNPAERRGYYIWLDSLEFMVLNIPRPDLNFVLRVPAKIARSLAEKRAELKNAGTPLDIHEADFAHIETSVRVYDELCQLFPKDFRQIDCVRSGALMTVDQIQQMLWETLQPHLPPIPTDPLPPLASTVNLSTKNVETTPETASKRATVRMSTLTAARIGAAGALTGRAVKKSKPYFIPATVKGSLRERYREVMDSLFELHDEISHRLPKESTLFAEAVLPVAALREVVVTESQTEELAQIDGAEPRILRVSLGIEAIKGPSAFTRGNTIARLASDILPTSYGSQQGNEPKLVSIAPRNELDTVPYILYPSSELQLQEIMTTTDTWSYEQKSTIFLAYLATGYDSARALTGMRYVWDARMPFIALCDLQQHSGLVGAVSWQALSPQFGFETPEVIENAGLVDLYERSFAISLELFSDLQAAGLYQEAQYATLQGHETRCMMQINGWTLRQLCANNSVLRPETREVLETMKTLTEQAHPLLLSDMSGTS